MTLSVARFNLQLHRMGQDMLWARAYRCPCLDPDSGAARAGCPVCAARGVLWGPGVGSRAGLAGMKAQRAWASYGESVSGDVVVSVPSDTPLYAAGENDRILFTDSSRSFDIVLTRGDVGERIQQPVIAFDRCFWLTNDGASIVEGSLPVRAPDGTVSFPGTPAPALGQQYTVSGRCTPEYFLFKDMALDRAHYGGLALPRRLVLRLMDLFIR